eukprot:m.349145 g.349145  ORF g.349145 m.349145 type:complete len:51 (-) comp40440_c0_seq1:727-879(-)
MQCIGFMICEFNVCVFTVLNIQDCASELQQDQLSLLLSQLLALLLQLWYC